jgi:hypothetical protein
LQRLANQLRDALADPKRVTKSYIPAANVTLRIDVPVGQSSVANKSDARIKRGRTAGSKDRNPRKRKGSKNQDDINENVVAPEEQQEIIENIVSEETQAPEISNNEEISINNVTNGVKWNRNKVNIDNIFAHNTTVDVLNDNDDHEPKAIKECQQIDDWQKWKEAIEVELKSLEKCSVFGPVVRTLAGVNPVGYKWVFVRKRNENGDIVRYKARLVAQGFSQRPGIDYEETYSPVMDVTTFRYLISPTVRERLDLRLMDVVTAYLYGPLDKDIYI